MNAAIAEVLRGDRPKTVHRHCPPAPLHRERGTRSACWTKAVWRTQAPTRSFCSGVPGTRSSGRPPRAAPAGASPHRKEEKTDDLINETHPCRIRAVQKTHPAGLCLFLPEISPGQGPHHAVLPSAGRILRGDSHRPGLPQIRGSHDPVRAAPGPLSPHCGPAPVGQQASWSSPTCAWPWASICGKCPWATLRRATSERSAPSSPPIWSLSRKTA